MHRTRRQAVESMEILNPTPDAPLGQIILHEGEESYTIRLGLDDFPTQSHLNIGTDRYHEIQGMAVEMTLQGMFTRAAPTLKAAAKPREHFLATPADITL